MVNYKMTLVLTIIVALVAILAIKVMDDMRFESMSNEIGNSMLDGESTRLILLYPQIFNINDSEKMCKIIDFNTKRQMDSSFHLVNLLKIYEDANLMSDYEIVRERYTLSNIELWFYITQSKVVCNNSNVVPVLFFHTTKTQCPECVVQGQILDKVRGKCKNFRIITVPNDLDIEIVNLIMEQYGVVTAPSLLINNEKLIWGVVNEEDIIGGFECY
jgi:hypothetical protein